MSTVPWSSTVMDGSIKSHESVEYTVVLRYSALRAAKELK